MKILIILGTRPEIIRLSAIMKRLDKFGYDYRILHTGQNYDPTLSKTFFDELYIKPPEMVLDNSNKSYPEQLQIILDGTEAMIDVYKPDKVLILGDTNSGLSSIMCRRKGIPVYHMEAGNRCYDDRVPEEANRKIIDSMSTVNLPYTELSRQNLLREGYSNNSIYVVGNPIYEVLLSGPMRDNGDVIPPKKGDIIGGALYDVFSQIRDVRGEDDQPFKQLPTRKEMRDIRKGFSPHEIPDYAIATAHRAENVDNKERLGNILEVLNRVGKRMPVVFSCHPRTKERMHKFFPNCNIDNHPTIYFTPPLSFHGFSTLEANCRIGITDSGTVQEELCLFRKPTVTIRDTTERPETVMCGSNIVTGVDNFFGMMDGVESALKMPRDWEPPEEYMRKNVSATVVNILVSKCP